MTVTVYDITAAKIQQLPESLAQEVSDFIDFLMLKHDGISLQRSNQFTEASTLVEGDFSDYLQNLEDYENLLAHGEITW